MNEEMAILLAREGCENAFRRLYEDHRERIYKLAYRYTRSKQDAEDVMQETFVKAFMGIKAFNYEHREHFSSWLNRICINCSIDYLRKRKKRKMDRSTPLAETSMEPESQNCSPEMSAQVRQNLLLIKEAIQKLSPKQRIIFDLRYAQHRSIKEIAQYTNRSESSIKTHLSRTVSKLRKQLGPILEEQ